MKYPFKYVCSYLPSGAADCKTFAVRPLHGHTSLLSLHSCESYLPPYRPTTLKPDPPIPSIHTTHWLTKCLTCRSGHSSIRMNHPSASNTQRYPGDSWPNIKMTSGIPRWQLGISGNIKVTSGNRLEQVLRMRRTSKHHNEAPWCSFIFQLHCGCWSEDWGQINLVLRTRCGPQHQVSIYYHWVGPFGIKPKNGSVKLVVLCGFPLTQTCVAYCIYIYIYMAYTIYI